MRGSSRHRQAACATTMPQVKGASHRAQRFSPPLTSGRGTGESHTGQQTVGDPPLQEADGGYRRFGVTRFSNQFAAGGKGGTLGHGFEDVGFEASRRSPVALQLRAPDEEQMWPMWRFFAAREWVGIERLPDRLDLPVEPQHLQ